MDLLREGILVGDTVRCLWHHACFGLRDGENLRPPALNPVTSWKVIREGVRVRVGKKNPPPGAKAPSAEPLPDSIVIIGAGPAGLVAAQTLRREGYSGPVTLIGAEKTPPVDRPNLSKDFLAGKAPEDWIRCGRPSFYEAQKLELRAGVAATAVDAKQRRVSLDDGSSHLPRSAAPRHRSGAGAPRYPRRVAAARPLPEDSRRQPRDHRRRRLGREWWW